MNEDDLSDDEVMALHEKFSRKHPSGRRCILCDHKTNYIIETDVGTASEECPSCGFEMSVEVKLVPVYCSCGCKHIEFSGVIYDKWIVLLGKCKHGDSVTHTIHSAKELN